MNNQLNIKASNLLYLIILILLLIRVISNLNLFNYSVAVICPVLMIPLGCFYLLLKFKKNNSNLVYKGSLFFYLICLILLLIPILQNIFFQNLVDDDGRYSHNYIWVISLLGLSWLFSGAIIGSGQYSDNFLKITSCIFFTIFSALIFYTFNGGFFVDYQFLTMLRSDGIKIHHLSLTEPLMLVFFITIASFYRTKFKWFFILITLYFMFALAGRVAFFCFIFSILFYEFISSNKLTYFFKISLLFVMLTVVLFYFINFSSDNQFIFDRVFFHEGLENDESFQGRVQFFEEFKFGILDQMIIGYPNFFIERNRDLGTYAHNILSVFQFYGLIPFLVILGSFFYIIFDIINLKIYKSNDVLVVFGLIFLTYTFSSVLVGKSVLFSSLWLILGFWFFKLKKIRDSNYVF
ncbi:hypothetical protein [Acinetobacter sp. ANC 3791]|uniref:hypothetical protein n=1 Tax=Acinetobacter sp. ANC 3791 TaxID=2529836 RepID=UPI00103A83CE|nr:hypothetical protein [Acinetobacter sp. ANC 3791]TCB81316.1 hypothetical protein E0H90_15155 [Acinetobacter sp. ANC 3791]